MEWLSDRVYQLKWQIFCLLERLDLFASQVGRQPFLDPGDFAWVPLAERSFPDILRELRDVQSSEVIPNFQDISEDQYEITTRQAA